MKRVALFLAFLWSGIIGASAQVDRCDVNGDGEVDISDVTYVIDHILGRGHASTPSEEAGEAIDLDLPSGTKWASCNVGATKPEEYGGYYAWGETEEKEDYDLFTYSFNQDVVEYADISGTKHDVAHVKWGGKWCMPTSDDIDELLDNCTSEWTTLNGVKGTKFTSKSNGSSIFLPAAGRHLNRDLTFVGVYGYYWSSRLYREILDNAYQLLIYSGHAYRSYNDRYVGLCVRPVLRK